MGVLGLKNALCSVLAAIVGEFGRKMELVSLIAVKKKLKIFKKKLAFGARGLYNPDVDYMFFSSNLILVREIAI